MTAAPISSTHRTWCSSPHWLSCWPCSPSTSLATRCVTTWTRARALKQDCKVIIGVISDTHGLLRPEALELLRGSEHIIHAGDIGSPEIVPALEQIAPVTAIRGNIDKEAWTRQFHETEVVELAGLHIYIIH